MTGAVKVVLARVRPGCWRATLLDRATGEELPVGVVAGTRRLAARLAREEVRRLSATDVGSPVAAQG